MTLYISGYSLLHRLNPLTKLIWLICLVLISFLGAGYWTPALLFAGLILPFGLNRSLVKPFLRTLGAIVGPLAGLLFLIHGFFTPEGHTILVDLGPVSLKQEGLTYAFLVTSQTLNLVGAGLLLVFTTSPAALMTTLAERGVPAWLTYILGATLQLIPLMQARAAAIIAAQRARGLETEGSLLVRARALKPLLSPLVLSALIDVEERAIALEARAFRARRPKTSLIEIPDSPGERILRPALFGLTLVVIGAGWWL